MAVDELAQTGTAAKKRRGAFPRASLKSVLELVDGIYELGHGDPVRRRTAFEHIGRSPDSSTSYGLNAAATSGYEVMTGGKNAPYLQLTPSGERIAKARDDAARARAAYDILFDNAFFTALVDKYSDRPMPNDAIVIDYLQREHSLDQADAATCWNVAKENIFDFGLFEDTGGKRVILPREHATARQGSNRSEESPESIKDEVLPLSQGPVAPPVTAQPSPHLSRAGGITPQIVFNIQVILPENASAETYDAIFQSMATHLLGRNGVLE